MAEATKATTTAAGLTCSKCGSEVGVIWYHGRSTVIDSVKGGQGNLVIARIHKCPEPPQAQPRPARSSWARRQG
jgi:hypothetical protein